MIQPEQLLTLPEAAAYLHRSIEVVRRLARRRVLHAVHRGARLRFRRADLDQFLARRAGVELSPKGHYAGGVAAPREASNDGELLHAIAVAIAGEHRLERILASTLEQLGYAVSFTGGSIALIEGDELVIRAAVGPFANTALGLRQPRGRGIGWQVITTGEPFLSHDLLAEGRRTTSNFRSYLAVPLTWRGQSVGMMELDSVLPHAFTEEHVRLLRRVALALSGAVELARRYTAETTALALAEQAQQRLRLLAEASAAFSAVGLDLQPVLATITRSLADLIGDACSIMLVSDDGQRLDVAATYHPDPIFRERVQAILAAVPYKVGTGALSNVVRTGQPLLIPTLDRDQMRAVVSPVYWPYLDEVPICGLLVVPVSIQGRTLGVLVLTRNSSGRPYSPEDQQLLQELADRAALALENARLYAAMGEQREYFRTTLASIGDAVIVTDETGNVRFINPVAEALTGWSAADAANMPLETVFRIVNATTREPVESPVAHVLRAGVIVGLANHTVLLARDGRELPIDDSGAPIRDQAGQLIGVVLVFRDITERYAAEQELRRSRDQLSVILRGINDGITVQDRTGALVFANDAAAKLSGFASGAEMAATPPREILKRFQLLDADGRPLPIDQLPGRRAMLGEASPMRELRFRSLPSGVEHWSIVSATPVFDPQGDVELVVNIFRDVTARKRAELAEKFLSDASKALAASLDETTTLRTVADLVVPALADWCVVDMVREGGRPETVAIAHVDPTKLALGWELVRRYPIDPEAEFGTAKVLRTGEPELVPEIADELLDRVAHDADHPRLLRALGFRASMCVALVVGGKPAGTIAFVSERAGHFGQVELELAEELARRIGLALENVRLYTLAQAAIAARDQFLSIASHELKTPLTSLLGYVGLLQRRLGRREQLSATDQRALQVIAAQAQRLNTLIVSLLDTSRLEGGQLSIAPGRLDLCALARRVIDEAAPAYERHVLSVDLPETPVLVEGDELRLEQALQNLLQNAAKYSPQGGRIMVSVSVDRDQACLAVRDEGIGIPEAALSKIFTRFFRAPNVHTARITGMGLGLYVVREIMSLHGGSVEVASAEGQGSTFTLCLPLLSPEHPVTR